MLDCLGWVTFMPKAECDLWDILKENRLSWEPRKIILKKYYDGFGYLRKIGLRYYDRKPANILMHHGEPKICDFGLACMSKPKEAFQQMGYLRKGAKFQSEMGRSLGAGTPGFCSTCQLFDGWNTMIPIFRLTVFFIFDWPSGTVALKKLSLMGIEPGICYIWPFFYDATLTHSS